MGQVLCFYVPEEWLAFLARVGTEVQEPSCRVRIPGVAADIRWAGGVVPGDWAPRGCRHITEGISMST